MSRQNSDVSVVSVGKTSRLLWYGHSLDSAAHLCTAASLLSVMTSFAEIFMMVFLIGEGFYLQRINVIIIFTHSMLRDFK